jgi:hypothetical protein
MYQLSQACGSPFRISVADAHRCAATLCRKVHHMQEMATIPIVPMIRLSSEARLAGLPVVFLIDLSNRVIKA